MAATLLPKKYTSQAREHVYVDFSNPLAYGLLSAYGLTSYEMPVRPDGAPGRLNGRKSSATPNPYTLHGRINNGSTEAVNVLTQEGSAWSFNGTYSTKAYSFSHPKAWTTPVTFIIRVYLNSNTADQCVIGSFTDGTSPRYLYGCGIYISGGTLYGVGANDNSRVISATAPDTGRWVTLACVTNTSDGRLYIDGQLVASGTLADAFSNFIFGIGCAGSAAQESEISGVAFLDGMVGYALTYKRALSSAEIYTLSKNPYQILRSRRKYLVDVVAGGVVTGTLSATDVADASSVSGSASAPSASGALSASDPQDAASFAGALIFSGSLAATDSPDAATFAGTAFAPGVSGTLAATDGADSAVFTGALSFVGSLSATDPQDAALFTGALIFSGSLAATDSLDSATFAGTAYAPGVSGTFAATDSADAAAFAGTAYAPGVSGTLAATDSADSAAFAGVLSFVGSLAAVEAQDSAAAAGTFGPSGSLAATDQKDSATFSGSHASGAAGSMAASDQADIAAFAGAVDNGGLSIVVDHRRVLIVPPQSRALAVSAETRVLTIQGE